jgi:pimeloyl-ACP methyl ester carboxylesterase
MRWRRFLCAVVLAGLFVGLYDVAVLISVSSKVLGFNQPFDRWQGPVRRNTVWIGPVETDVYLGANSRTPVLIVHGVNETGKNSLELKQVAEALAGSGFRVVVPQLERLTRQNVTPADVDDVVELFRSLDADGGIVCASYGCGPALIAASRPEIRDRVRFVLTFGAYYDLTETLRFVVTGPESPLAYSKWLYMIANADLLGSADRSELSAIATERMQETAENWRLFGEGLSPDARALLSLFESQDSKEFDRRLDQLPALKDRLERLSPSRYFDGIRARLIIVHMSTDPAIPADESARMADAAKVGHIPYTLTILNMQGHTRPAWPPFDVPNLFGFYVPGAWQFGEVVRQLLSFS